MAFLKNRKFIFVLTLLLVLITAATATYFYLLPAKSPETIQYIQPDEPAPPPREEKEDEPEIPISKAKTRITKKPFGIYVTPQNSPVQPEKFQGYHTGTDFETFPNEQDKEVPIYAICDGKAISSGQVSGYGGLLIQSCNIESQTVTVLYGHLNLASLLGTNTDIKKGQKIGVLALANSSESGFERKHLHLGIHKGEGIDYRGYVDAKNQLESWIDAALYL